MAIIWGNTKEAREASKQTFEDKILLLLKESGTININYLFKLIKHSSNQLHEYQRIAVGLENLIDEGKITIDKDNNISLTKITVLDEIELKDQSVWEIERKEKKIKENKELIKKFSEINPLL